MMFGRLPARPPSAADTVSGGTTERPLRAEIGSNAWCWLLSVIVAPRTCLMLPLGKIFRHFPVDFREPVPHH